MSKTYGKCVIVVAMSASVGCLDGELTSSKPPMTTSGSEAESIFLEKVQPALAQCTGCHSAAGPGTNFTGSSPAEYEKVRSSAVTGGFSVNAAMMITKVTPGNHYGTKFTDAQLAGIAEWFQAELNEGGTANTGPTDALSRFAGCATLANFNLAQMGWGNKQTNNDGACQQCHIDGAYGFLADGNNPKREFVYAAKTEFFLKRGYTIVMTRADGTEYVAYNEGKFTHLLDGSTSHPRSPYGPTDIYVQRVKDFVKRTNDLMAAGECPAGGYVDDPIAALAALE